MMAERITRKAAVVTAYPHVTHAVFTETSHHVAALTYRSRKAGEAMTDGRDIFHATIECAIPQPTLTVTDDGIDKAVVVGYIAVACTFRIADPSFREDIVADQSIITADEQSMGGYILKKPPF